MEIKLKLKRGIIMRRIVASLIILTLLVGAMPEAMAQRGANTRAIERASDEAIFHRVGDWFATRGKSKEEKKAIIAERKAKRRAARAKKAAEKRKKEMEKKAKETQARLNRRLKKK